MTVMSLEQALALAIEHHRAGRLNEAESLYRQILSREPNNPYALNLLGIIALQVGRHEIAIDLINRAISIDPNVAEFHNNLAIALHGVSRIDQAINSVRTAILLKPGVAATHRFLGDLFKLKGDPDSAIAAYRMSLELDPAQCPLQNNLGTTLQPLGRIEEAIEAYRAAIQIDPAYPQAYANLGDALRSVGKLNEAIEVINTSLKLKPDSAPAWNNLGNALRETGQIKEAIEAYQRAIALDPGTAQTHHNLGIALIEGRKLEEAIASHRKAVSLASDWRLAHYNLAVALLQNGEFEEGWKEHEWRIGARELGNRCEEFPQPRWDGHDLRGKRILLHTEQGFGDAIQFIRYLPMVIQTGATVLIRCQVELLALFQRLAGIERCITRNDPLPDFDVQCPLLSLPNVFKTTLLTIPANVPYLEVDPEKSARWKARLAEWEGKLKVGLVWTGRPTPNPKRSVPWENLAPLAEVPGVALFSLQKTSPSPGTPGEGRDEGSLAIQDWSTELNDFSDTAAMIDSLDLVISIDTAVAHLAGALGKPTWVLLPYSADWRWMIDRNDSPWYPTMRLFRQPKEGDWESPVRDILQAIKDRPRISTST